MIFVPSFSPVLNFILIRLLLVLLLLRIKTGKVKFHKSCAFWRAEAWGARRFRKGWVVGHIKSRRLRALKIDPILSAVLPLITFQALAKDRQAASHAMPQYNWEETQQLRWMLSRILKIELSNRFCYHA